MLLRTWVEIFPCRNANQAETFQLHMVSVTKTGQADEHGISHPSSWFYQGVKLSCRVMSEPLSATKTNELGSFQLNSSSSTSYPLLAHLLAMAVSSMNGWCLKTGLNCISYCGTFNLSCHLIMVNLSEYLLPQTQGIFLLLFLYCILWQLFMPIYKWKHLRGLHTFTKNSVILILLLFYLKHH